MTDRMTSAIVEDLIYWRDKLKGLDAFHVGPTISVMADAANALDNYAKTMTRIEAIDARVTGVLTWLDERGRNSTSYGSHADAYEIAARRLREAMHDGTEIDAPPPAKATGGAS